MENVKNNINILTDIDYLVDNSIRHRDTYGLTNLKILFIFERLTPILAAEIKEKLDKDYFNKYGTRHRIFTSLSESYRNKLSTVGDIIIMGKLNNLLNYLRDKDTNTFKRGHEGPARCRLANLRTGPGDQHCLGHARSGRPGGRRRTSTSPRPDRPGGAQRAQAATCRRTPMSNSNQNPGAAR